MKIARSVRNCRLCLAALLCLAILCVPALEAQGPRLATTAVAPSGPRALAVLELAPDGRARLVPVAIRIDNKFYDAGLYRAMPRPMAVDPQTVYEVQRSGEAIGLFTVTRALAARDVWVGLGQWRPGMPELEVKKPAPAPRIQAGPADTGQRPVLKRAPGSGPAPADSAESKPAAKPDTKDVGGDRPTLRRPGNGSASTGDDSRPSLKRPGDESASNDSRSTMKRSDDKAAPAPDDDPDRPSLKKPAESRANAPDEDRDRPALKRPEREPAAQAAYTASSTSSARAEGDPERPTLRRGKPAVQQTTDETAPALTTRPGATPVLAATGAAAAAPTLKVEVLAAISDARVAETRSFLMQINPTERQDLEGKVQAIAYGEIQKWAAARPPLRPAAVVGMRLASFQVFNFNNDPVAVYTAEVGAAAALAPTRRPASASGVSMGTTSVDPGFRYFVTVVVRRDMYGDLHTLLAQVTDTRHLDAYRRYELIDAVDAEGTRAAQLLFRRVGDRSFSYGLYRVTMDRCWPVFESAGREM